MAEQNSLSMPAGFGGLMRYSEEYTSKFNLKPIHIIVFVFLIILFRFGLSIFVNI